MGVDLSMIHIQNYHVIRHVGKCRGNGLVAQPYVWLMHESSIPTVRHGRIKSSSAFNLCYVAGVLNLIGLADCHLNRSNLRGVGQIQFALLALA